MPLEDPFRQAIQDKLPRRPEEEELQGYLVWSWSERHQEGPNQYRNGYGKPRSLSSGVGDIWVQVTRLRRPWESQIVRRYQRMFETVRTTLPELYLLGLATGDFAQCLHTPFGEDAP